MKPIANWAIIGSSSSGLSLIGISEHHGGSIRTSRIVRVFNRTLVETETGSIYQTQGVGLSGANNPLEDIQRIGR